MRTSSGREEALIPTFSAVFVPLVLHEIAEIPLTCSAFDTFGRHSWSEKFRRYVTEHFLLRQILSRVGPPALPLRDQVSQTHVLPRTFNFPF